MHFHIVLEYGRAGLDHLVPGAILPLGKAEAVTTNDCAVLQDDAVSDAAVLANYRVGMGDKITTDFCPAIDGDEAVQDGVTPDFRFFVHVAVRADMRPFTDFGRFRDDRRWMNARSVLWRSVEQLKSLRKSQVGIGRAKSSESRLRGVAFDDHVLLDEHRGSARGLEQREIFSVGQKSYLVRTSVLNAGNAGNLDIGRALETAAQFLSKFGEFHGRSSNNKKQFKSLSSRT